MWTVASPTRRLVPLHLRSRTMINQTEVLIALVVAAHAGVLAVRLAFSLYQA